MDIVYRVLYPAVRSEGPAGCVGICPYIEYGIRILRLNEEFPGVGLSVEYAVGYLVVLAPLRCVLILFILLGLVGIEVYHLISGNVVNVQLISVPLHRGQVKAGVIAGEACNCLVQLYEDIFDYGLRLHFVVQPNDLIKGEILVLLPVVRCQEHVQRSVVDIYVYDLLLTYRRGFEEVEHLTVIVQKIDIAVSVPVLCEINSLVCSHSAAKGGVLRIVGQVSQTSRKDDQRDQYTDDA